MVNGKKRNSEARPATRILRLEYSPYNQSPKKRKTEQQERAVETRMRRNNQSAEKRE